MITINSKHAAQMLSYLKNRGGIAVWNSVNLSNPGLQLLTPAKAEDGTLYGKPSWQVGNVPDQIITSADDVVVSVDAEVKRFHVAVRASSNGLMLKVTDAGSRKINAEVAKAGKGAYHVFDYDDYKNAVIMAPVSTAPLAQYAMEHSLAA